MMRTIRANNRAARRKREHIIVLRDAVSPHTPFCYLEYRGVTPDFSSLDGQPRYVKSTYQNMYYDLLAVQDKPQVDFWLEGMGFAKSTILKRQFTTLAKAIAHLTALKLNACEEEEDEWKALSPCKLVQGYYTASGKEYITETKDLTDERNSVGRDNIGSGQLRKQRQLRVSVPQNMASPWATKRAKQAAAAACRSSRTVTTRNSTTTMDPVWNVNIVSDFYGGTTTLSL